MLRCLLILGIEVIVVDGRDRPLEFLDDEIVDELIHQMRNKNVLFRLNETVNRLEISSHPQRRAVIRFEVGQAPSLRTWYCMPLVAGVLQNRST